MKKFIITKENVSVKFNARLDSIEKIEKHIINKTFDSDRDCKEIAEFESEEEARKAFEEHKENLLPIKSHSGVVNTWDGEMLCLLEREEDEDGYWLTEDTWEAYIDMGLETVLEDFKSDEDSI